MFIFEWPKKLCEKCLQRLNACCDEIIEEEEDLLAQDVAREGQFFDDLIGELTGESPTVVPDKPLPCCFLDVSEDETIMGVQPAKIPEGFHSKFQDTQFP